MPSFSLHFFFQEAHKLLQPADMAYKTMAIELAEYQVGAIFLVMLSVIYDRIYLLALVRVF